MKVFQCCSLLVWFIIACVGKRAFNLDYGVVYIPSNTFVEFWNYPPSFPPTVPQVFYVGILRTFRFVCLKRSTTASWFLTTPPVCCLPSASSIDSLGYFWDEASSRWRNSCRFRTELSLRHFIVRCLSSSRCTLIPWAHLTLPTKLAFWFPTKISIFSSRLLENYSVFE